MDSEEFKAELLATHKELLALEKRVHLWFEQLTGMTVT